jgi:hypothetical protein
MLSISVCITTTALCMNRNQITFSDNKRFIKLENKNKTEIHQRISVQNKSYWPIQVRIEGSGVVRENSQSEPYTFNTANIHLDQNQKFLFMRPTRTITDQKTTLYHLAHHALIVYYDGNKQSEKSFAAPFDLPFDQIVIKSYATEQGLYELMIEDKK